MWRATKKGEGDDAPHMLGQFLQVNCFSFLHEERSGSPETRTSNAGIGVTKCGSLLTLEAGAVSEV